MLTRICILTVVAVVLLNSLSGAGGDKKPAEDLSEMKVRLRLNAIETSILLDFYAVVLKREVNLRDTIRASIASGNQRLPEFQKAQNEAKADLEQTMKRLIILESEKARLVNRLGPKFVAEEPSKDSARISRILDQVLERLNSIEARLKKLER